jgi:protein kinase A
MHNDCETTQPPFVPETDFNLDYFDTIVPIHSIHMGYFALGYRGNHSDTGVVNKYVLKRLFKSVISYQNNVKHVLDEAKILESLNSPFVLRMLGKFQTPDELIFVFETVPSGDLWTLIHEHDELRDPAGFLMVDTTRFYMANIILALEHMHDKKVAYRNLKPENILMNSNGYIKVAGMAFAKVSADLAIISTPHTAYFLLSLHLTSPSQS